ncbi:MAG: succinyl-diaminopimelate desuccinylase [Alphaproteobacteria bacterium]
MSFNVIDLTSELIACPSVAPKDEGAQLVLAEKLKALGFECHHLSFGEGDEAVPNLFARLGSGRPHICYAGHTDVVPPGSLDKWTYDPFKATIKDGVLYGRGSSDMKGSIAAFVAAVSDYLENNTLQGSISFLITGDEEGPAVNGTVKVLEWMKEHGHIPDVCLVGEPTNTNKIGETIALGRRGSINSVLTVKGKQGHVAYQEFADNPVPGLITLVSTLAGHEFDQGSEHFPATNLEFTGMDIGAGRWAENVIPASARAMFNIRFNDLWTGESLRAELDRILGATGIQYELQTRCSGNSFLTPPGPWSDIVRDAAAQVTGLEPEFTTGGATSDARFIAPYCPALEFGGINTTIHQVNENARVEDLEQLVAIFRGIIERADQSTELSAQPTP